MFIIDPMWAFSGVHQSQQKEQKKKNRNTWGKLRFTFKPVLLKPPQFFHVMTGRRPTVTSFSFHFKALTHVYFLSARLRMVCLSGLLVAVLAFLCVPSLGSACWDSPTCSDLSSKEKMLVSALSVIYNVAVFYGFIRDTKMCNFVCNKLS